MAAESPKVHVRVGVVTERIRERSRSGRADSLARMDAARQRGSARAGLSCTNLAHGFAASDSEICPDLVMRGTNTAAGASSLPACGAPQAMRSLKNTGWVPPIPSASRA